MMYIAWIKETSNPLAGFKLYYDGEKIVAQLEDGSYKDVPDGDIGENATGQQILDRVFALYDSPAFNFIDCIPYYPDYQMLLIKDCIIDDLHELHTCVRDEGGMTATYYLYLTEDGESVDNAHDADYTFTAKRDISAYANEDDMSSIYETETMKDATFAAMINDLCREINENGWFIVVDI